MLNKTIYFFTINGTHKHLYISVLLLEGRNYKVLAYTELQEFLTATIVKKMFYM